jgi:hypothetical protein
MAVHGAFFSYFQRAIIHFDGEPDKLTSTPVHFDSVGKYAVMQE